MTRRLLNREINAPSSLSALLLMSAWLANCGSSAAEPPPPSENELFTTIEEGSDEDREPEADPPPELSPASPIMLAGNQTPRGNPDPFLRVNDFDLEASLTTLRSPTANPLGGSCTTTLDCQAGLGCATPLYSGRGQSTVSGGYCSIACETNEDCSVLASDSLCLSPYLGSDLSFCTSPCTPGVFEPNKCNGRADVVCRGRLGAQGYCVPNCTSDSHCASGICSPSNGTCSARRLSNTLDPIGSLCPIGEEDSTCNGYCVRASEDMAICSATCQLGGTCGYGEGNVCAPSKSGARVGDFGVCESACSTSEDCQEGYTVCAPTGFTLASGEPQTSCGLIFDEATFQEHRLSVEDMARASLPESTRVVRNIGIALDSFIEATADQLLTVDDGALCLSGPGARQTANSGIEVQFGSSEGVPHNVEDVDGFSFDVQSSFLTMVEASLSNRPGVVYRAMLSDGEIHDIGTGTHFVFFNEFQPVEPGAPPWDSSQLEMLRFQLSSSFSLFDFRFCVDNLNFGSRPAVADAGL